jgi:Flp pilus assembly protein TadG
MDDNQNQFRVGSKTERGSILVFATISLTALLGLAAWATETGRAWQTQSQLQAAADAAALAGVGNLLSPDFLTVDEAGARTVAMAYGPQHEALGVNISLAAVDVEAGSWDMASQTFTAFPGNTDPDVMRAVRVIARRDSTMNGPINTIFGRVMGIDSITVRTDAIAEWGFAGGGGAGVAELPIAIDCCAVAGNSPGAECTQNYCETVSNTVPNPCLLSTGETASCLEFYSTPVQNACWTTFDGDSPAVSTNGLTQVVQNGNSGDIGDKPIYLDNGTKTPIVQDIKDRFDAEGTDTSGDGTIDSWVVSLPMVECQNPGDQCASGNTQEIVGFLCLDIREIIVTPDKIIKGDFICASDPRCDMPGLGPGGSVIGSVSADYPVIVN